MNNTEITKGALSFPPKKRALLLPAVFSILSSTALWIHLEMNTREPLIILFLCGLFVFFKSTARISGRRIWYASVILGCVFSLCYTLAKLDLSLGHSSYYLYLAVRLAGFSILFANLLASIFSALRSFSVTDTNARNLSGKRLSSVFLGAWLLISLCFLFWLLYNYPGEYTNDSDSQLLQILGKAPLSNHHPVAHTAFMGIFIHLGLWLSGGELSFAVAFYCAVQAIIMAACFAFLIETLYRFEVKFWVIWAVLGSFLLLPYHGSYSSTVWKDVLFAGIVLLLCTCVWRLMLLSDLGKKAPLELVLLFVSSIGMCLFRTNGLYAFVVFLPFLVIYFFRRNRTAAVLPILSAVLAIVVRGPLYSSLDIAQPDTIEALNVPAQHIAAVISKGGEIKEEQYELLEKVVDIEKVAENYHPNNADYIKILVRESGDQQYIAQHSADFLRLWLELGLQNPGIYLRAQINQTMGYWYPDVDYWFVILHTSGMELSSELGLYKDSKLPSFVEKLVHSLLFYLPLLPFAGLVLSIGFALWVCLGLFTLCIINGKKRELIIFIPVLAVWATLLIATPVYAEFRYIYCLFTTLPLLAVLPFSHVNNHKANVQAGQ